MPEHSDSHQPADASQSGHNGRVRLATSATIHCLAGCGVGEVLGVILGVALGFTRLATITLAVSLVSSAKAILSPTLSNSSRTVDWISFALVLGANAMFGSMYRL